MDLSPVSMALYSWSHSTSTIRELIATTLEEWHRGEEERGGGRVRQLLRLSVARPNNITRDEH